MTTERKTSRFTWFVAIVVVLIFIGYWQAQIEAPPASREPPSETAAPAKPVGLHYNWALRFGNLLVADLSVKNPNGFAIRDLQVKCVLTGRSGTTIGRAVTTIYDKVPAGGRRKFAAVRFGAVNPQAYAARCYVLSYSRD